MLFLFVVISIRTEVCVKSLEKLDIISMSSIFYFQKYLFVNSTSTELFNVESF